MATLLALAQDIADELTLERPTAVIGSTDQTARRILRALTRTAKEMLAKHTWPTLIREHSITTAASTETYALPSDWDRYINDTAWDASNYWEMRGSLTAEEWQFRKNAIIAVTTFRKTFRVRYDTANSEKRIFIDPVPDSAENLLLEYVSKNWCESSGGAGQDAFAADTDVLLVPEEIATLGAVYRVLRAGGFAYADEKAEYDSRLELEIANSEPRRSIDLKQRPDFFYNLPEGNVAV